MVVENNTYYSKLIWQNAEVFTPLLLDEPVLYCTTNGKLGVFKNTREGIGPNSRWKFLKEKYNVVWWVYQYSIVPVL